MHSGKRGLWAVHRSNVVGESGSLIMWWPVRKMMEDVV